MKKIVKAAPAVTLMRTSKQIKAEIKTKFGFIPPFFTPAESTPQVLENLWQQTILAYVNNPLPLLFKEKLAAYLSRFCAVPYCMICHSCTLHSLKVKARDVLELLESPPPSLDEIDNHLSMLGQLTASLGGVPGEFNSALESNAILERTLLACSTFIFLEPEQADYCRSQLSRLLGFESYQYLVALIAYIKTCHVWMAAHPEVAYESDKRVKDNFSALIKEEPGLGNFFRHYRQKVRQERQIWLKHLAESTERKRHEEELRQTATENLRLTRAVASVSDGVLITDPNQPDNPIIYANPAFYRISGYRPDEVLGCNCRFLQGPGTDKQAIAQIKKAIAERQEVKATVLNYRKEGQPFWNELKISPVFSDDGNLLYFVGIQTDITERKRAEEALQKSENHLRAIIDAEPECVKLLDANGIVLEINAAGVAILEADSADTLIGKSVYSLIAPEYREAFQRFNASVCQGQKGTLEFEIIGCRGTRRWMETHAVPLPSESDGQGLQLAITRDITQRKQAEEERDRFFTLSIDMLCISDFNGYFQRLNQAFEKTLGYTSEELQNQPYLHFVHPEDQAKTLYEAQQLATGKPMLYFENRYLCKNGTWKWLAWTAVPVVEARLVYAIARDVTERKRWEEQIREQATLLDKSQDAILVLDTENRIRFWNQSAQRLYGWTADEVVGCSAHLILFKQAPPQLQAAQQVVLATGEWQGELHQITKDNQEIIVESRWTLVRDAEEQPQSILIINTDITEKKQLEAQFYRAQRMESIGTLASGIAHDLNNILTPILASVQILQMVLADERSQRMLNLLEANAKRGAELIKQVLSFVRGVEGDRETLHIESIIRDIEKIAKETFPKSINIDTDIPVGLWPISGDATQLHQVLMNLCVNARDAMPNSGILTISARNVFINEQYARIHLDAKPGPYVVLEISDTGNGISPEIIDRIFEPFFTTKDIGKGTGLGLSTAVGMIKGHGGFINVYSELRQGTQFNIYLPALETVQPEPEKEGEQLPLGNGELILVVDDEVSICEIAQASLEAYNYRVMTAHDGLEAIALYAQHREDIDVVLVDMMMPSMDGATTIRNLEKINPQLKIIATSGLASNVMVTEETGASVKSFLPKPYTAEQLLKTLRKVLSMED